MTTTPERAWCRCGDAFTATSDPEVTADLLAIWRGWHKGPRHGRATRQQPANARRVQARADARRRDR